MLLQEMLCMDSKFSEVQTPVPMAPYFANLDPLGNDLAIDSEGPDANSGAIPVIKDENARALGPFTS